MVNQDRPSMSRHDLLNHHRDYETSLSRCGRCEYPSSQQTHSSILNGSSTGLDIDVARIPSADAPRDFTRQIVLQSTPVSAGDLPLEYDQSFVGRSRKRDAVFMENGLLPRRRAISPSRRRRNAVFLEDGLPAAPRSISPTRRRRNAIIFQNGYLPTHHKYQSEQAVSSRARTSASRQSCSPLTDSEIAQPSLESRLHEEALTNQSYGWDVGAYYAHDDVGTGTHLGSQDSIIFRDQDIWYHWDIYLSFMMALIALLKHHLKGKRRILGYSNLERDLEVVTGQCRKQWQGTFQMFNVV
ncbi:uncharacterized protein MELLADRAFT_113001 [Melampsora larici-populina 98AG31]|uniref:Uncharacterized protein n=1 Tax=Melampsora larici-populina (strain 98AG31 / pathotype 3-4-7) TaxID=747676 RepID=F4S8D5_MELLP|nr:uncharacterized protein MELLADRAFT_113001 [Melampsora larici-populina 98AG31]EGF99111.1 hypothetical protein MELLADRAFT_113001 [Melampsora larici-populina 98AG31]